MHDRRSARGRRRSRSTRRWPDTAVFPPVPSVVPLLRLPPDPADSGFGAWRRIPIPRHDKTPAAWTMRAGNWDFLLGTPRAMDAMDSSRIIDTTLANCRKPLNISEADSARVASARPVGTVRLAGGRPAGVRDLDHARAAQLHRVRLEEPRAARDDPARAALRHAVRVRPQARPDERRAALAASNREARAARARAGDGHGQGRRPGAANRPDPPVHPVRRHRAGADRRHAATELLIWTKAGGDPDHIVLPGNILHIIWWEYLRWRAARLATRDQATSAAPVRLTRTAVLRVPTPVRHGLRTAIRRQREGRFSESATLTLERLTDEHLSLNDRRIALMSMANTFQMDDDAPAAAFVANELTAMDPCALSGTGSPGGGARSDNEAYAGFRNVGAMLDHTRSGVRCTSYPAGATLLRGLLVPGYGQYTTWSHLIGLSTATLTVAGLVRRTRSCFRPTTGTRATRPISRATRRATSPQAVRQRHNASTVLAATIGLWIATAVEAEWQERVHASRLAAVHDFWFEPIVTSPAGPGGASAGLAGGLRFDFR